ncbi:Bsmp protein [Biomphalaria glabrata]|nr:3-ketoacyl-CoA thiolase; mitochondrial-like protein [Biomphalaria glabrata]
MYFLKFVAFLCAVYGVSAEVCPQSEVLFVLDFSDAAYVPATSNLFPYYSFDLLKAALDSFLNNNYVDNSNNDFRVGAIGYGSRGAFEYIPIRSYPNTAKQYIYQRGNETYGASWTYVGLRAVTFSPIYANNKLIVISAQGTSNSNNSLAFTEALRLRNLGWNINVIAMQGQNPLDLFELTGVNNNVRPVVLSDLTAGGTKSYRYLSTELANVVSALCSVVPTSTVCSNCMFEGGFAYEADPMYCDSFYQCVEGSSPVRKMCPAGTFWDGSQCNFMSSVSCPYAECTPNTVPGTRYPSGRCCNKYFECSNSQLVERACPIGQYFDSVSKQCSSAIDVTQVCQTTGRFECDVARQSSSSCNGFDYDPTRDPCKFQFQGKSFNVAPGTIWNQNKCSLDYETNNLCYRVLDRNYFALANPCTPNFLATFNGGSKTVFSPRLNADLPVYVVSNQVVMTDDVLQFTSAMADPYYYLFFFNNKDFLPNTAFRVRFRLDNAQLNRDYDILSNSFCALCPDTLRFSVTASSSIRRVVSVMFVTTGSAVASTSAVIDLTNSSNMIELLVIFGDSSVYGQLREYNNINGVIQRVNFNSAGKLQGSHILTNKCGIQLGRGPNSHFLGIIDEFAVYENCANINSLV